MIQSILQKVTTMSKKKIEIECIENDKLAEAIKGRELTNEMIWDFFRELRDHLNSSEGFNTADNYDGKYAEVMPLFIERYPDVAKPARLDVYKKRKVKSIMDKLGKEAMKTHISELRPEIIKMLLNYIDPEKNEDDGFEQTVRIVVKTI
jgi:hypothetical protein